MFLLFSDRVLRYDLTIKGINAIIKPRNKELISYIFFLKIGVIKRTGNIKTTTYPIPILDKNLKDFILSILSPDTISFK